MRRDELQQRRAEAHYDLEQAREKLGIALLSGQKDVASLRQALASAQAEAADVALMMETFPAYQRESAWAGSLRSDAGRRQSEAEKKRLLEQERAAIVAQVGEELGKRVAGVPAVYRELRERYRKDYTMLTNPTQDPAELVRRARQVIEVARTCNMVNDVRQVLSRFRESPQLLKLI